MPPDTKSQQWDRIMVAISHNPIIKQLMMG